MGKGKKEDVKKPAKVSTIMAIDKVCKPCKRYSTEFDDENVATSLYLLNAAVEKLGDPERIKVTVEVAIDEDEVD